VPCRAVPCRAVPCRAVAAMEKSIQWCYLGLPMHGVISRELETVESD